MKIFVNKKNGGYSVILSLMIIGFLIFLGIGVFNLILNEMKDTKSSGDYIKAFAGAESAQELALLQIKEHGYAYYDKINHNLNNRSIMLSTNPLDVLDFVASKDVFISYDIGSKVNDYEGTLDSLEYDIIPLFYINDSGEQKVSKIDLSFIDGDVNNLAWNIIGKNTGMSGVGSNTLGVKKTLTNNGFKYENEDINTFLSSSDTNYLVLFNSGNSGLIKYNLKSHDSSEYFSKPETTIISSAQIGNYKQNLSTFLDNTKYLNILKYSIFSN